MPQQQSILVEYRKKIEKMVKKNPWISNQEIADQLSLQIDHSTIGCHRRRWGLPNYFKQPEGILVPYRKQIERMVKKNPGISNKEILEKLPIQTSLANIAKFRRRWELPSNAPVHPRSYVIVPYRKQIEQMVAKNPKISNQEIIDNLPTKVGITTIKKYRIMWKLPRNPATREIALALYRDKIERMVAVNPLITNSEILDHFGLNVSSKTLTYYRRKWGIPPRRKPSVLDDYRKQILRWLRKNPDMTNRDIAEKLPIEVSTVVISVYRRNLGFDGK